MILYKFENGYESRWVVKQLLRVISENIYSIIVEAIDPEEETSVASSFNTTAEYQKINFEYRITFVIF